MTELQIVNKGTKLLADEIVPIVEVAKALKVDSEVTHKQAMAIMTEQVVKHIKKVKAYCNPRIMDARKPYDNEKRQRDNLLASAEQVRAILDPKILKYEQDQEDIRREEERIEREKVKKEQAKIDKANAKKADKARIKGDEEKAQAIEEAKIDVPVPVIESKTKVTGIHTRDYWKHEVTNFKLLNKKWKKSVEDESKLKAFAKNMKKAYSEPGLRIYNDPIKVYK